MKSCHAKFGPTQKFLGWTVSVYTDGPADHTCIGTNGPPSSQMVLPVLTINISQALELKVLYRWSPLSWMY